MSSGAITVVVPPTAPDLVETWSDCHVIRATYPLPAAGLAADVVVADGATLDVLPPLNELPRLRLVQTITSGVDGIRERVPTGVTLCNVGLGVHDASVAEWVVLVTLSSLRERPRPEALSGKRMLIIGYGAIGRALEARLHGFEVSLTRVAAHPRPEVHPAAAIPSLLGGTDVVVLLAPATEQTRSLVDAVFLRALPDEALLVNASRGELVDQDALLSELACGRLYAALDVTNPDPLPDDHPLRSSPNCILTPHVAGLTGGWDVRAYAAVERQIGRLRRGEPLENVRADY